MLTELLSGLGGAALGAFVTFLVAQRRLHAENVTLERRDWREKVRELGDEISIATEKQQRERLARQLELRLNPNDSEDQKILTLARKHLRVDDEVIAELNTRLALLLKHDWERAKVESSWQPWRRVQRVGYKSTTTST